MFRVAGLLLCVYIMSDFADGNVQISASENQVARIRCPGARRINVYYAQYGYGSRSASVTKYVIRHCHRRQYCNVRASNSIFRDPAFGLHKTLSITFACVADYTVPYTSYGYERSHGAFLKCSSTVHVIQVLSARYGKGHKWRNVKSKVQQKCNRMHLCRVPAENYLFGDPAFGARKQLIVKYRCKRLYYY